MKRALSPAETPQVGRSLPRLESWLKVTGRAEYVHNLRLPGMLYGRIFRSSVAHGRIRRLDVSAAQAVGGVHRVVTAADLKEIVPDPYYGPAFHDQPVLAVDKVRYVGEPVAVVLAADPHVAEEAAHLIVAEYEELPAVYDELEAMTSKAIVHDVLKPAGTFPDLKHLKGRTGTNVALDFHLRRGDAAQALAAADRVFEHRFRTQQVMHTPLEPLVSVAESTDSSLTIHTASQSPSFVRIEVARLLGWPENRIRVRARVRGLVERRRLRRHRAARDAEVRLHRGGPLRHRARRDRLVRAVHESAACRRAARLRHPAAGVGLRVPHRHDGARTGNRSDRVSPQEPAARRAAAGDRHADARRGDREGPRPPCHPA